MNTGTIHSLLKSRGWSQSTLAQKVCVSRQAVSLWMKQDFASVRAAHLLAVSQALGVGVDTLVEPLPGFGEDHEGLMARYLWDRLYPDLDDFAVALHRFVPEAVGRLVQVDGLYAAEKILGRKVWTRFDRYQRFLEPARRKAMEGLVSWRIDQTRS